MIPPKSGDHDLAGKADLIPRGGGGTCQSFIQVGSALLTATPLSGKSKGKTEVFQGQGKVREFCFPIYSSKVFKTLICIFFCKRWKVCCKTSKAINLTLYACHSCGQWFLL